MKKKPTAAQMRKNYAKGAKKRLAKKILAQREFVRKMNAAKNSQE